MTVDELEAAARAGRALEGDQPVLIRALWHDAAGDWSQAHALAQQVETADGAWVHAYLHRKEGDLANAQYWYRRAGRSPATGDLWAEWREIAASLLAAHPAPRE
ncbi:MAG TPA: hypothetical protein VIL35_04475 [Vicinamibacterales bacterium]